MMRVSENQFDEFVKFLFQIQQMSQKSTLKAGNIPSSERNNSVLFLGEIIP